MNNRENVMKICGNEANTNFDILHTRKLLHLLFAEYQDNKNDVELMEIISEFAFALLGDFDASLEEESTLDKDKQKTIENIDKLCNWLYGGYHSDNQLNFRK